MEGNALNDTTILKGSYVSYQIPTIEDNSMFIDEALNQTSGSFQFVSSLVLEKEFSEYQLEVELPLAGEKHQLSFGLPVTLRSFRETPFGHASFFTELGDFQVTYRPLLLGRQRWCLLASAFTFILPTKKWNSDFTTTGSGAEIKIAVTKRLKRDITAHLNLGGSIVGRRKPFGNSDPGSALTPLTQRALLGAGLVWAVSRRFDIMFEHLYTGKLERQGVSVTQRSGQLLVSPAIRFALNIGKHQVVPAFGFPVNFSDGAFQGCNPFVYVSFETGN